MEKYEFKIAFAPVSYQLAEDRMLYRQGLRLREVPLAAVRGYALRVLPRSFFGDPSVLVMRVERAPGRVTTERYAFTPSEDACQRFLTALRARLPAVDLTQLPWREAAARMGVAERAWWEVASEWRFSLGLIICVAGAMTGATSAGQGGREERLGAGIVVLGAWIVGIVLMVKGWRRYKTRS